MTFFLNSVVRLVLACILGGTIGYEREQTNRPAGFRTHILVCVGAALVMLTSEFIFNKYSGYTNLDPARLGAQVISGIGFLGAVP
jgi:putative Mg2+ transporter-C (MgtC) family protein